MAQLTDIILAHGQARPLVAKLVTSERRLPGPHELTEVFLHSVTGLHLLIVIWHLAKVDQRRGFCPAVAEHKTISWTQVPEGLVSA